MQPRPGSATEFVLAVLRENPDRELRLADFEALAGGKFKVGNLGMSLKKLLDDGQVTRTPEGIQVWWAISAAGLMPVTKPARSTQVAVVAEPEPAQVEPRPPTPVAPPASAKRPLNVIRNSRW